MSINFKKITFNDERGEFERVARDFSDKDNAAFTKNKKSLEDMYSKSSLSDLTDAIWPKLENSESFLIKSVGDIEKAIRANSSSSGSRNIGNVVMEFLSGSVRAPIILCYNSNKNYTLVAGNTRLMVARLLKIKFGIPNPKCVFIKSDW